MGEWERNREEGLLRLEQAKDAAARVDAVDALRELALSVGKGRARELQAALPGLLVDTEGTVRAAAVALAATVLEPSELEDLVAARLGDADPEVRVEAAAQLAHMARPDTRGLLARGLEDEVFEVRFESACGMAALRHPAGRAHPGGRGARQSGGGGRGASPRQAAGARMDTGPGHGRRAGRRGAVEWRA
jgi:HEAT repeat protein